MEEIVMAIECINPTIEVIKLKKGKKYPDYNSLTTDQIKTVETFVKGRDKADSLALKMIHLESSVQLVFYLTLLIANLNEIPVLELKYDEPIVHLASIKWIVGLIWFLLKTLLSGYTTFSCIFRSLRNDSYRLTGSAPSIVQYISLTINTLLDLWFAAVMTFLEGYYH